MSGPRVELAALPTPLLRARGLERALDAGPVYVKRDDLTGFAVSGNKARALEHLLGDATGQGADVLVAGGSASSNFCAAAAVATSTLGLECELPFPGAAPRPVPVNVAIARAAGARLRFGAAASRDQIDEAVAERAATLRGEGRRPYAVPRGGATPVGAVGYALAAQELGAQCVRLGVAVQVVVVAAGSGATLAGLVAGQVGFGLPWRTVGASVSRPAADLAADVLALARGCANLLGLRAADPCHVDVRDLLGPGFGVPSGEDRVSADLALRREGLLLDHYYGAKAMTLMRSLLAGGCPTPIVFWHTGGVAAALAALTEGGRP